MAIRVAERPFRSAKSPGKPLKFEGIGEKLDDIQVFNPASMADRILGMGDTINLVKKAQEHIDEDDAKKLEQKIRSATFTYEDYLKQIQMVKKMGSLKRLARNAARDECNLKTWILMKKSSLKLKRLSSR